MSKTFSIKTLGCKLNQYESSEMVENLTSKGWLQRPFGDDVDVVLVNTCTVTDKSDKKCFNYIKQGAKHSLLNGCVVTGCMVENSTVSLENLSEVKGQFHNNGKKDISDYLDRIYQNNKKAKNKSDEPVNAEKSLLPHRTRANLKIQDGCDGECSYCIIPSVRGVPVSRDFSEIVKDAKDMVARGIPEIVLTGITIGKYSSGKKELSDLVEELIFIKGDFRIRITSIEPHHVNDSLIQLLGHEKVCNHLHLPVQSGSEKILKLMNRPYSIDEYKRTIEKIKTRYPEFAIGTDIIIGFPGESENDFMDSMDIIKWAEFSYVHQFTFSVRQGTPAAEMIQNSSSNEISLRGKRMKGVAERTSLKYREKFIGKELMSVIEGRRGSKKFTGTTGNYLKIDLDKQDDVEEYAGTLQRIKLIKVENKKNFGKLII